MVSLALICLVANSKKMTKNDKAEISTVAVRKSPKKPLKTPQSLIHIKHTISLLQYKLWILLLQEFKRQFDMNEPVDAHGFRYVSMGYIEQHIGYTPSRQDIINDLRVLRKEEICFNYFEKDGRRAQYFSGFISEMKVTRLTIGFKFPSVIDDVMLGVDNAKAIFQMLNWDVFNHFSGKYEAIIYKLCKDYIGVGRTPYMTIDELREYMGVKPSEYAEFMKLNEWVIKKPIKSINESEISDILVEATYNRNGRKVIGIYFNVKLKHQTSFPFVEPRLNSAFTYAKVTIPTIEQQEYLAAYTSEQISLSIERANQYCEQLEKQKKSANYGAIYKTAITENWGQQFEEQRVLSTETKVNSTKNTTPVSNESVVVPNANKSDWSIINQRFLERFKNLPEVEQHSLIDDCIKAQKQVFKTMARKNYEKFQLDVLDKPSFTALLWPYLAERWNEPIENFLG